MQALTCLCLLPIAHFWSTVTLAMMIEIDTFSTYIEHNLVGQVNSEFWGYHLLWKTRCTLRSNQTCFKQHMAVAKGISSGRVSPNTGDLGVKTSLIKSLLQKEGESESFKTGLVDSDLHTSWNFDGYI